MRSPLLALVACIPLVACAAESDPIGAPEGDAPELVGADGAGGGSSGGAAGGSADDPGGASGSSGGLAQCIAQPSCDGAAGPELGQKRDFRHSLSSFYASATPYHRGRDMIYAVGDAQWIIGKFTYSLVDKDLTDEDVDVWVERDCAGTWEKLGTGTTTTNDGLHPPVEGVEDTGGRLYFQIPKGKELPVGRHRVRLVVAGDLTSTDLVIDVVPKGTKIVVSDVDGTLTSSEAAEFPAMLTGDLPGAQPKAADVLSTLANEGYRIVYLTARPEWLTARTHEFLTMYGFPPGIVHPTSTEGGALGGAAAEFKSQELASLASHSLAIGWAFGNQPSDTDAYDDAQVEPVDHRVFLRLSDAHGGRRIESYGDLLPVVTAEPKLCR
jgi:hypothetical protein